MVLVSTATEEIMVLADTAPEYIFAKANTTRVQATLKNKHQVFKSASEICKPRIGSFSNFLNRQQCSQVQDKVSVSTSSIIDGVVGCFNKAQTSWNKSPPNCFV